MLQKSALFILLLITCSISYSQQEDPLNPIWQQYHTAAGTNELLNAWNKTYPNLTKLYSIGQTLKGTPLMVLEITNQQTGAAEDKPAYYYDCFKKRMFTIKERSG